MSAARLQNFLPSGPPRVRSSGPTGSVVFVNSGLAQEMLVGAGTMQKWDISIVTQRGLTEVFVGRDMRDPDINDVV